MSGTLKVPPEMFFPDPPFSKFWTKSCPPSERVIKLSPIRKGDTAVSHLHYWLNRNPSTFFNLISESLQFTQKVRVEYNLL